MTTPRLIAITGGIGAGKSVVSHVLAAMGYDVYDCDSRARRIVDDTPEIHRRLVSEIHPQAVIDGHVDRKQISEVVFNDPEALRRLNAIVHTAVIDDLRRWCDERSKLPVFVETAILYDCDLWRMVDDVWEVTAPVELRIDRVMRRNNLTRSQVSSA